jgi:hypothetical protein
MDVLIRIKWSLLEGRYTFSRKARIEIFPRFLETSHVKIYGQN